MSALPGSPGYNGTPSDAEGGTLNPEALIDDATGETTTPILAPVTLAYGTNVLSIGPAVIVEMSPAATGHGVSEASGQEPALTVPAVTLTIEPLPSRPFTSAPPPE